MKRTHTFPEVDCDVHHVEPKFPVSSFREDSGCCCCLNSYEWNGILQCRIHIVTFISDYRLGSIGNWIKLVQSTRSYKQHSARIKLVQSPRSYKQHSAIADLHNLQFTVTHALGFSVFTSGILVTELK
jgi:hypothetical protein